MNPAYLALALGRRLRISAIRPARISFTATAADFFPEHGRPMSGEYASSSTSGKEGHRRFGSQNFLFGAQTRREADRAGWRAIGENSQRGTEVESENRN